MADRLFTHANDNAQSSIRLGAAIVRTCADFLTLIQQDASCQTAMLIMRGASYKPYLPAVLNAIEAVSSYRLEYESRTVSIQGLSENMVLDEDLRFITGTLLVARGTTVTESLIIRLQNLSNRNMVPAAVRVLIPHGGRRVIKLNQALLAPQ